MPVRRYTELNGLALSDAQKAAIVDEANVVFALNIAVFDELEGNGVRAALEVGLASLKEALRLSVV